MAIYYLDVDDEITVAAARIRDTSDSRVALVLTGGSRLATSRINFRLLAREARRRNKQLAIVTSDPSVQSVVRSADLRAFASVGDYERAVAGGSGDVDGTSAALEELASTVKPKTRVRGGTKIRVPRAALIASAAVLVLAIGGSAAFFLPNATVTLTLRTLALGPVDMNLTVDPNAASVNVQQGIVPGFDKAFPVQASGTFNATGEKVTETPATGAVTFTSINTISVVPIYAGTQVSTSGGVVFVTKQSVTVPKADFSTSTPGVVTGVPVQAVVPGTDGNVAANAIVKVPTEYSSNGISVTNPAATSGGTHEVATAISQADIDNATRSMLTSLSASFKAAMNAPGAVPSGSYLFSGSAHLGVAVCNPDPATLLDLQETSFQLTCNAIGTATIANQDGISEVAENRLRSQIDGTYDFVTDSISTRFGSPTASGARLVVPMTASALQAPQIDVERLKNAIAGMSVADARTYLAPYGDVEISSFPGWAGSLPSMSFRIDLRVVVPDAGAGASPSASAGASGGKTAAPPKSTPHASGSAGASSPPPASGSPASSPSPSGT
jgi:hypothetical protein